MTRQELERELRARLAREFQLIRDMTQAQESGEDTDPIEHAISVNAGRIDFLQARLNKPASAGASA